jgi:hypothetical protein
MLNENELLEIAPRLTPQWLAGFFDGEGCVSAYRNGAMYNIKVILAQSDPVFLSVIALKFPNGNFMQKQRDRLSPRPCYRIQWGGRSGIPILEFIKDHVLIKKIQVEAALEMLYLISKHSQFGGNSTYTDQETIRREELGSIICHAKNYDIGGLSKDTHIHT